MPRLNPADSPICYLRPRRIALSAWSQHVPFGMYLVALAQPSSVVELGTRNGVSYSAFCQAVVQLGLSTRCTAVDSWQGDAHTGAYGPGVLEDLRRHHEPLYSGFSILLQSRFDEAAEAFPPGSVDLLHIDGFHTYEAASHDFETWLPKLSQRAVVLFHDVAERGRGFGVWILWEQLKQQYPAFTFFHGHGLGVLGVGPQLPEPVAELLHLPEREAQEVRRFFSRRGRTEEFSTIVQYGSLAPVRVAEAVASLGRRVWLSLASNG